MREETVIPNIRQETKTVKMVFELKKDLQENEIICEHCHGTGLRIVDNVYGIHGDITHIGVRCPYKKQSISFCEFCYNGVLHVCEHCGSILTKQNHTCCCAESVKKRFTAYLDKEDDKWMKAKKMPLDEALEKYRYLYIDNFDKYVESAEELEELIRDLEFDGVAFERESLRIYATTEMDISLDASDIIENVCEELHEDAYTQCDVEGLQGILDAWCGKQTGATTYFADFSTAVFLEE